MFLDVQVRPDSTSFQSHRIAYSFGAMQEIPFFAWANQNRQYISTTFTVIQAMFIPMVRCTFIRGVQNKRPSHISLQWKCLLFIRLKRLNHNFCQILTATDGARKLPFHVDERQKMKRCDQSSSELRGAQAPQIFSFLLQFIHRCLIFVPLCSICHWSSPKKFFFFSSVLEISSPPVIRDN